MKIVHHHIFKNAGTSIDDGLKEVLGDEWASFEGEGPHDIKSNKDIERYFLSHPNLRAVSTHLGRPQLPLENYLPIVFLRHPFLRAKSVYEFTRRDATQPFALSASGTFADYLNWVCEKNLGSIVVRNYQVVHLSEASFNSKGILHAQASEDNLAECIGMLNKWPFVGIVEDFGGSMHLLNKVLTDYDMGFIVPQKHSNKTTNDVLCQNLYDIPKSLYEDFMEMNQLDTSLYQFFLEKHQEEMKKTSIGKMPKV